MTVQFDKTAAVAKAVANSVPKALLGAALIVEGAAKGLSPVDTGNLRGSITHVVETDHAKVGTNVEYSIWVEAGTSKMAAQPYLRPGLDNNKRKVEQYMGQVFAAAIKGVTG
jgi:HK97 gp10 family phage protein